MSTHSDGKSSPPTLQIANPSMNEEHSSSMFSSENDAGVLHVADPSLESHESTSTQSYESSNDVLEAVNESMSTITSLMSSLTTNEGPSMQSHESMSIHSYGNSCYSLQEENQSMSTVTSFMSSVTTDEGTSMTDGGTSKTNGDASTPVNEETTIERIGRLIDPMTEMFATYFKPTEIAKHLNNLDGDETMSILNDSMRVSERGMRSLLDSIADEGGGLLLEFYSLITRIDEDTGLLPMALLSGSGGMKHEEISEVMKFIVELVEQRNLGSLTSLNLKSIADKMVEERFMKKPRKSFESMSSVEGIDYIIFTLVRKSQPDWPLHLWKILQKSRPDLFPSENNGVDVPITTEEDQAQGPSSSDLAVENPTVSSSECSSTKSSKAKEKRTLKQLHVTVKNQPALENLLRVGALKNDQVTREVVKPLKSVEDAWNTKAKGYFSDEDEDEETELKVPFDDSSSLDSSSLDVHLNLREYQKELAEPALLGKNTIVCAPTGCGKTRVAVDIIIKHLRTSGAKPKPKVCFFARTVPLAVQQHKTISKKLPEKCKIKLFTGDSEHSSSMHLLLDDLDVVVLTPMILQNHILQNHITCGNAKDLSVFSLLIFDECHHTREKEPYNILMASYVDKKLKGERDLPQVVGLTASFPVEKAKDSMDAAGSILQLCANMDAHTVSVVVKHKKELEDLVPVPNETFEYLQERDLDESYKLITDVMEKLEAGAFDCAKELGNEEIQRIITSCPSDNRKLQKYNNWSVRLWTKVVEQPRSSRETNMSIRLLMIITQYLTKYQFALETHDLVHLQDVTSYLDDCFAENRYDEYQTNGETRLYDYFKELRDKLNNLCHEDNPNLHHLMKVIDKKLLKKGSLSRGIVFVRTRTIAEALASWLNRCEHEGIRNLKASIFTGVNAKESQGGMTQAQQNALVEKFREGKVRLLVATSVAEEGMDVPECNLVIKYNHVGNEITTIQTRGRSRKRGGHSVLLAMSHICEKEMINKKRTELMYDGIDFVRKLESEDFIDQVIRNQIIASERREIEELIASQNKIKYKDKKFTMICKLCRKFTIQSENIRTLCRNHRVVVDKNVWDHKRIYITEPKYLDEIQIVGSVRCNSEVENGMKCRGPLGTLVYYNCDYFLALGIKNFTVDEENENQPRSVRKWKDLPYPLKELNTEDMKMYIKQKIKTDTSTISDKQKKETNTVSGVQETGSSNATYLSSFGQSVAVSEETRDSSSSFATSTTLSSGELSEICKRYPLHTSQDRSGISSFASGSTHHATQRKEVVTSELDSGLDCGSIPKK